MLTGDQTRNQTVHKPKSLSISTKSAKPDEQIWSFVDSADDTQASVIAICESAQIISLGKASDTKKTCYCVLTSVLKETFQIHFKMEDIDV